MLIIHKQIKNDNTHITFKEIYRKIKISKYYDILSKN